MSEKSLHNYWMYSQSKYLKLPDETVKHFLPFLMYDNYELGYFNLLYIMNKQRNIIKVREDEYFKPLINNVNIENWEKDHKQYQLSYSLK